MARLAVGEGGEKQLITALPKLTWVARLSPLPMMVTGVPPAWVPWRGSTAFTTGLDGMTYVNASPALTALVPFGVVTKMSTEPRFPGGVDVKIRVSSPKLKQGPGNGAPQRCSDIPVPKVTDVAPVKLFPKMAMSVPPAVVPLLGSTP
jgi:hypothetical protein